MYKSTGWVSGRVLPLLFAIFLAGFGRGVLSNLETKRDGRILGYVDDFLVPVPQPTLFDGNVLERVLEIFSLNSHSLTFTHKTMT